MTWGVPHKSNRQLTIGRNIPTGFFILLRKLFLSPSHIQTIQITSSTFGIIIIRVLVHNITKDNICVKQVLRVGFFLFSSNTPITLAKVSLFLICVLLSEKMYQSIYLICLSIFSIFEKFLCQVTVK